MASNKQKSIYGLLLKYGSRKIDRNTGIFVLPAGKEYTCAVTCKGCYARRDQALYPGALGYRLRMYELSKKDSFVDMMNAEIDSRDTTKNIRIHESGDFYSQEYVDKWDKIIKANPHKMFYAYTKREDLDFSQIESNDNFNLIRSYVVVEGKKIINFADRDTIEDVYFKLKSEGLSVMICDPSKVCMKDCSFCLNKGNIPLFVKH